MVNKKIILSMLTIVTVVALAAGTWAGFARTADPIDDNTFTSGHLTFSAEGKLLYNSDNENSLKPDPEGNPVDSTPITITNDADSVDINGITLGLSGIDGDLAQYITVDKVTIGDIGEMDVSKHLSELDGENTIKIPLTSPIVPGDAKDLVFHCHLDGDIPADDVAANQALQDASTTFSTTITGYQLADDLPQ